MNKFKKISHLTGILVLLLPIVSLMNSCSWNNSYDGEAPLGYKQPNLNPNPKGKNQAIQYYMVSTGNGLASFIKLSNSKSAIIFDTGIGGPPLQWKNKLYQGNTILEKTLRTAGVTSIDAIFLSHFHTDHYSNLRTIINDFPVKRIIPNISYSKWDKEFGADLAKKHINIAQTIKTNYLVDSIVFEDWSHSVKTWMQNLPEKNNERENDKSNIISFQYYGKRFLITGDADQALGTQIVQHSSDLKPVDFYQVPHHGSDHAAGTDFLAKVQPKYCYIPGTSSKNKQDPWAKFMGNQNHNFPKNQALENLKKYSTDIRMTGEVADVPLASEVSVQNKTLIFDVNNLGIVTQETSDLTVINNY